MPGILADINEHRSKRRKLSGSDLYHDVLGSPKLIVAPMVDQSELPWRILSRRYGAQLIYTPMINAKMFADPTHKNYREQAFNMLLDEEGSDIDRPLIVQFAANDPDTLLKAAKMVESHCDAVDINFGCPQDIARRGHYGCYLQDDWDLIYCLINILHENLSIPVTAKFRVFPSLEKTVEYAKMMERAGAQILTCHGRMREQRGQNSGLADWGKIRAVKEAVSVPVFANGNILFHGDIERCLRETGADAVMTAEGNLYNPTILLSASSLQPSSPTPKSHPPLLSSPSNLDQPTLPNSLSIRTPPSHRLASEFTTFSFDTGVYLPHTSLALEYISIVRSLKTPTHMSAIKGHLFKLLRPALNRETDIRERLGRVRGGRDLQVDVLDQYEGIVKELEERMKVLRDAAKGVPSEELVDIDEKTGLRVLPLWLAQPYFRSAPKPTDASVKSKDSKREPSATISATPAEKANDVISK